MKDKLLEQAKHEYTPKATRPPAAARGAGLLVSIALALRLAGRQAGRVAGLAAAARAARQPDPGRAAAPARPWPWPVGQFQPVHAGPRHARAADGDAEVDRRPALHLHPQPDGPGRHRHVPGRSPSFSVRSARRSSCCSSPACCWSTSSAWKKRKWSCASARNTWITGSARPSCCRASGYEPPTRKEP